MNAKLPNKRPFKQKIIFNKKDFTIFIKINEISNSPDEYHYDLELVTKERISGDELQKLRKYLEDEGYIDAAIEYYEKE
jgi:hypothetical protein